MTTLEGVRVLHVDDAPEFAELAAEMLEREDDRFTVDTASSASEGLDRLDSHEFDCIVSDYEMPGTNGIDFLRTVREQYADLPFILFTGKGSEEVASDAISAGVTDYLQKKSTTEQYELLANRIRNAVDRYEAERERRRWKRAVETANEGIAMLDDDGRYLQMNDAYAGAYGRDPEELIGKTSRAVYPDEVAEWFQEEVRETLRRDGTWKGEAVGQRADGTEFEQQLSLAMLEDGGHVCVMEDITERRRRERKLERQNERLAELIEKHETAETRYRSLFENAPIVVWEEDLSGLKERVDDLATEVEDLEAHLEDDRETLLSLADAIEIHDVNEYAVEHYDAPSKEALMENLDRIETEQSYEAYREELLALAAGETQITIETQAQTFDGELKDELLHVFVPEAYAEDYSCAYVTATDITQRKDHERELREQREWLRQREEKLIRLRDYTQELMYAESKSETATIALHAVDEILGFDLGAVFTRSETQEGVLQLVEVLNRPRMEKMYGGLPAFLRDAPAGTHSALAWEVFESGESVFINDTAESDTLTRKSPFGSLMMYPIGRYGIVLLAATRMDAFTETEELLLDLLAAALETAFDRLEREHDLRRQRDELERQNERLDEFASVVSHDLRNPLNVAADSLELASAECDSDHLDRVGQSLQRMRTLIEDLLTVAREGEPVGDLEPVALAEVADACWETVATENATLVVDTDVTVRADRSRLKQLFENLIRNAVEHGDTDVTVTIRDGADGFSVADDGHGIPGDERDEVFDAGHSTTDAGTGFGLAIVEEIAEAHGWDIRVTDSQDGGARFEITGVETVD